MNDISRREALSLGAGAFACVAIPAGSALAAAPVIEPVTTSWLVGSTDGEWDWQHIVAKTEELARREWATEYSSGKCECGTEHYPDPGDCDFCCAIARSDVRRIPEWDGKDAASRGDWIRAGMGCWCSRCENETYGEANGHAIGDEAVCEECMTIEDWEIVDPEYAAELKAELADE